MKPQTLKGTRDFLPEEVQCRQYIFDTLRRVFEKFDFLPIETPAMESLQTLTGKYGDEGDQLLFKLLNNGDFLGKVNDDIYSKKESTTLLPHISKRGLRYDLTVPLARYVVMHQNDIAFPFKRYQIQQVWRADRPQKGRYQEFYQCDIDIIGSDALLYEAELIKIYDEAFTEFNIPVVIRINNRKILQGIAETVGAGDQFQAFTIILDKLDKIGPEKVSEQWAAMGMSSEQCAAAIEMINTNDIASLEAKLINSDIGMKGISEMQDVLAYSRAFELKNTVQLDWTLARGLNYYTGCIIEVVCPDVAIGSIGGGGRYDDLTGVFGMPGKSGVGVSFGAARIYDVMKTLELFPTEIKNKTKIMLLALDDESHRFAFTVVSQLRDRGIAAAIYPTPAKMKKQMKYANDRAFPYVGIIGEQERMAEQINVKNMESGEQELMTVEQLAAMWA